MKTEIFFTNGSVEFFASESWTTILKDKIKYLVRKPMVFCNYRTIF